MNVIAYATVKNNLIVQRVKGFTDNMPKKYNYTVKTGRPTKYKEEYVDEVDNYINQLNDNEVPLKEDFAFRLGVDDDTLDNWAKNNKNFFGALKRIMQAQKIQLINDGIYGGKEVNPTITKLLLQNNHGMKERQDVTTNDKELPTPIIPSSQVNTNDPDE